MWIEVGRAMDDLGRMLTWAEIAFPDLRLQTPARIGGGVDALVVSWPVHVLGAMAGRRRSAAGATLFVEPQVPTNHLALRGLAGARVYGFHSEFGAVIEGGTVVATDGHGAFAGGGPGFGDPFGGVLALVGRRYFVVGADRWDFTLEISVPMRTLAELFSR